MSDYYWHIALRIGELLRLPTCDDDDDGGDDDEPPCQPTQGAGGNGNIGMGSAASSGGVGCGNPAVPSDDTESPGFKGQRRALNDPVGRFVVKVYSHGSLIPFTGLSDAGGYFFIPLIPQDEPFTAIAYDTLTGQTRTFEGVGPKIGDSVRMFFDFISPEGNVETVTWDGEGDGVSWQDPYNWRPNIVPGPGQHAVIDVPGTITVTYAQGATSIGDLTSAEALVISGGSLALANASVVTGNLTLAGGVLSGAGALTVTDVLNWTGGTMSGPGTTIALGSLLLTGNNPKTLDTGRVLNNTGSAIWSGGHLNGNSGAVLNNRAGATFDIRVVDNYFFYASGGSTFNNAGTLIKSVSSGATVIQPVLNDTGSINVQSGTLSLSGNSTHTGNVQGTAQIEFGSGTHVFSATSSLGTANVRVSGGTTQVYGAFAPVTSTISAGTLTLNHNATYPNYVQTGGVLSGTGALTVTGVLSWTSGTMSGPGATTALSSLQLTSNNAKTLDTGRILNNAGSAVWSGGHLSGNSGAVLNNRAGATFDIRIADNYFFYASGGSTFNNAGTFVKSVISGTTFLQPAFTNTGSVSVLTGSLQFGSTFTQGATGILHVQIGGLAPVTGFDRFTVTGQASLDGTLNVTLINSYVPSPGNSFAVMTFGSRVGQFATVNGNGQGYNVNYNAGNVTLVAQ